MKHNNFVKNEEKTSTSQTIEKLKDFCGYTTAHGLGRLVESKGYVRKVFWVMACLGAFSMFASQVISLAQQYVSRPVETYISMKYVRDIDFPVVTICNLNAIRQSKIYANDSLISHKYLRSLLNGSSKGDDSDDRGSRVKPESRQIRETNLTTVMPTTTSKNKNKQKNKEEKRNDKEEKKKEEKKKDKEEKKEKKNEDKKKEREDKKKKEKEEEEEKVVEYVARQERLSVALATMPEDKLSTLGHQFNDMFRECTYRGKSCLKSGLWDSFWHYKYGNCYSFNKVRGLTAGGPGPSYGLLLEINAEQNEYASDLTKDAGIRVQIESPGKVPFPYEKGFSVGPGSATSVGMRKVKIKRVDPFKDGSCMEEERREHKNLFLLKHNATYSITACRESCLSDKQKERCGCREYRFPKDASKNESVCDTSNATVAKCLKGVMKKYRKSNLGCSRQCASPCNEDVYKLTISTSKFPSLSYQTILGQDKELTKRNISVDDLGSYLLQLNVFFEELNYEIIEEHMSYGFVSFISDIGGNVGMWIGVSVLTCAELLELLYIIIHHAIKKCAQRGTKIQSIN